METSTDPPVRAAIYARISRDREGAGLGVERQEADCRALAERLGWQVVAVFVDNDVSAYSGRVRPQYRAMLDEVRSGGVKAIVAWHTDRLHRRTVELEEFVNLVDSHGVQIQTVTAGEMDLTTATGRMYARTLGNLAHYEVDHARERTRSAKAQMAKAGKYRGGRRPYGFESDGVTIREDEAAVIRAATTAVLAGRTLAAVARELNEAGRVTSTGRPWTYARLRDVLIRARNAGLVGKGRAERSDLVVVGQAVWPAIVDEQTWRAVYTLLTRPERRLQQSNEPRWLGSGIYTCGLCGSGLRASGYGGTPTRPHERRHVYRCTASAHLTISLRPTDEYVLGVVADLVRDPRVVAAMEPSDEHLVADGERRAVLAARLAGFESDYALGTITGAQLAKATAVVGAEMTQLDDRLAAGLRRSTASSVMAAADPGAVLLAAPLDVQRAVIAAVVKVEVGPVATRGSAWSAERVRLSPMTEQQTT